MLRPNPHMEKAMEVNPGRKTGVESLKWLAVTFDLLPATPAATQAPYVMLGIPLDLVGAAKREVLLCGPCKASLYNHPGLRHGEVTPVSPSVVSTTRKTAVKGMSLLDWCRVECHGLSLTMGGIIGTSSSVQTVMSATL